MKILYQKKQVRNISLLKKSIPLCFLLFFVANAVSAQNYTLTSNGDQSAASPTTSPNTSGGLITLRSALEASTQIAGTHVITIPASITTINITGTRITVGNASVGNNITINGPGKSVLTINQTTPTQIFFTGGGAITFTLNDVTLNYTGTGTASGGGGAIQSGGINAVTTLNRVAITNFNFQIGNGGGMSCSTSNFNTLNLTDCDFTNNLCGGGGGALSFNGNSTCTITNCIFTNNGTGNVGSNTGGGGGAISTTGSGAGGTYTVTNCTFINNHTTTAGGQGGLMINTNGTLNVSFCNFVNNSAATPANGNIFAQPGGGSGVINCNNNWWGVNSGPATNDNVVLAAGGTINCIKWLQLKSSASPTSVCANAASTVTASFLSNSAGETVTTANISSLIGKSISFNNAVLGTAANAQATIQSNGMATANFLAGNASGTGSVQAVVDNIPATDVPSKASITITAPSISGAATLSQNTGVNNNSFFGASCAAICRVVPSGVNPISGNVNVQVWIESSAPVQNGDAFVQRHYQITPAAGTTGTVTLYFTQAEFNNFNSSSGSAIKLPTASGDGTGISHLRIAKYSGTSSGGTGLPPSYPGMGAATIIDPPDANIIYNTPFARWEVTFDVTGFSGFIVQTKLTVLPVKLVSFTARQAEKTALLNWKIAQPEFGMQYELQRSLTGNDFKTVYTNTGDQFSTDFNHTDPLPGAPVYYYRLQMRDAGGQISYSNTVTLRSSFRETKLIVYPDPAKRGEELKIILPGIAAKNVEIISVAGKKICSAVNNSSESIIIKLPVAVAPGIYFVKLYFDGEVVVKKILIE